MPSERNLNQNLADSNGYSGIDAASVSREPPLSLRPMSESAKFIQQMMIESRLNNSQAQLSEEQMKHYI